MFAIARYVFRHKIGATAIVALGVFFMMPGDDQAERDGAANPWSAKAAPTQFVQGSQVEETSFVGEVFDGAVAYLDEAGMNPLASSKESAGNLEMTAGAVAGVNGH